MPNLIEVLQYDKQRDEFFTRVRFGGGLATNPSISDVDFREATDGENFDIQIDRYTLTRRQGFDYVATAPNGLQINGFVELIDQSADVTLLVQAGGDVYQWDGASSFTLVGTVSTNSRLRGNRDSTDIVNDRVIVTDLNKQSVVKTWDGTTFADLTTNLGTAFYAKYCVYDFERAMYFNVRTTTDTPHLLVGSKRNDIGDLTVSDRPSSSLSDEDPFFLPMPDQKPGNGLVSAFGQMIMSTDNGQVWLMSGTTAKDFAIGSLFKDSFAAGDEAVINTQNDVVYGRAGKIESLIGVLAYGNVVADDVSRDIKDIVSGVTGWTGVYNPRTSKAYFWPDSGNEVYALHYQVYDSRRRTIEQRGISPWAKWTTDFGNGDFRQTAAALLRRPADNLDLVYFGDQEGRIFVLEGSSGEDGADAPVTARWRSGLITLPYSRQTSEIKVILWYAKQFAADVTIRILGCGETAYDDERTLTIPALSGGAFYNGSAYYNGSSYYGVKFAGRLIYQEAKFVGRWGAFQVEIEAESSSGFRFEYADVRCTAGPSP